LHFTSPGITCPAYVGVPNCTNAPVVVVSLLGSDVSGFLVTKF
jgi:hypothetical protein